MNKVELSSEETKYKVSYIKGLVYFYSEKFTDAIVQLEQYPKSEKQNLKNDRQYILLQCYLKEKNLIKGEELCLKLEHAKYKIRSDIYFELYKLSEKDSAVKYAQKYINYPDIDKRSDAFTEIMYFLGSEYWFGKNADKYHNANVYLIVAAHNGCKEADQILDQYGVEKILIIPADLKDRTYQFEFGYRLTAPQINFLGQQAIRAAYIKSNMLADLFMDEFSNSFKSLQDILAGAEKLYSQFLGLMVAWGLKVLMRFGIDEYGPEDILARCDSQNINLLLHYRIPEFIKLLNAIEERAEQLNIQTESAKLMRGKWTGVGFGSTIGGTIGAAVKASVAAGIMNIGSSVIHGIGDSIAGAMNNSEIRQLEKNLFGSQNTKSEFRNAVKSACGDISAVIFRILSEHEVIGFENLIGKIEYCGEDLSSLDNEKIGAKLYNNYKIASNYEYSYALALEQLRREFDNRDTLKRLARITSNLVSKNILTEKAFVPILEYAEEFGFDSGNYISEMEKECHIDFSKIRSNKTDSRKPGSNKTADSNLGSDKTSDSKPVSPRPKISLAKENSHTASKHSNEHIKSDSAPAQQNYPAASIDLSKSSAKTTADIKDDVSASVQQNDPVPGDPLTASDKLAPPANLKLKNKWTAFFLCLFLGVLGAHKFYEGKTGMGILYLFTAGLYFIGIIVDLIKILGRPKEYDPMT